MLSTSLIAGLVLTQSVLPDAIDHLKSAKIKPNIGLLLDASCSMRYNPKIPTSCTHWANTYNGGNLNFTKNQAMRAVLTGCATPTDGILDKWSDQVDFSIYKFGHSSNRVAKVTSFGSSHAALESGAMSIPAKSNTPMTRAIRKHAKYFQNYFNNANTKQCRPNFLLLLSDGNPNGSGGTYSFNCPVSGDPTQSEYISAYSPWKGSRYLVEHKDMLCSVDGHQQIRTYTIGFGAPGSFSPSNLQKIADKGQGEYFYASNVQQLDAAFSQIISSMASRASLFYSAPAVQVEGLFSDNYVYTSSFKPNERGPWHGTVKKNCIEPKRLANGQYDTSDVRCIFKSDADGKTLLTNPAAEDLWTGTTTTAATVGGSGEVTLAKLGVAGGAPKTPYYPRNIKTWRQGTSSYVNVHRSTWTNADTWTLPSEHHNLINRLHGYSYNAHSNGDPVAVGPWPTGDTVHADTVQVKYGKDCTQAKTCYLVVGANDGALHFIDAANGQESVALIPAEVWKKGHVNNEQLKRLESQPDVDTVHRYFVDGGMTLYHDDANGDGVVQSTEDARLLFGLGRGGAAYYQIPMSVFTGDLDKDKNPVLPLTNTDGTAFGELQDTWAAPWAGQMEVNGTRTPVAIFPSGHIRSFDEPDHATPSAAPRRRKLLSSPTTLSCSVVAGWVGLPSSVCSNWTSGGYPDPAPGDLTIGPFKYKDGVAFRIKFSKFDLDPDDRIEVRDGLGRVAQVLTGNGVTWTEWIYDTSIELRLITDGNATSDRGYTVSDFEVRQLEPAATVAHNPSIYVVDLAKWNGASAQPFATTTSHDGVVLRIARQCSGGSPGVCVDKSVSPDLENMTCPVSTPVSVFTVHGVAKTLYWGDECGQIFKAFKGLDAVTGTVRWQAKRLFNANTVASYANQSSSRGKSKDLRKIFRRLDLVSSTCPGRYVTGVYFGTGNVQRPAAVDELKDSTLTSGRDLVGVVWDSTSLPSGGAAIGDLTDASSVNKVDPRLISASGKHGWYVELQQDERLVRDPLVFEGTAYYKTTRPQTVASECSRATVQDAVYAVNSCTSAAVVDTNKDGTLASGERRAWTGNTDVGGNLLVVTPKNGAPIVSHANITRVEKAMIKARRTVKVPRIFNWREPRRN